MKNAEIKTIIENSKSEDGSLDYSKITENVNLNINNLVVKKEEDYKKNFNNDDLKNEAISGFLKEYNFENADQFSAFVKNTNASADEITEKNNRITKDLESMKKSNSDYLNEISKNTLELNSLKTEKVLLKFGVNSKYLSEVSTLLKASKNEDIEEEVVNILKNHPTFGTEKSVKIGNDTGVKKDKNTLVQEMREQFNLK